MKLKRGGGGLGWDGDVDGPEILNGAEPGLRKGWIIGG